MKQWQLEVTGVFLSSGQNAEGKAMKGGKVVKESWSISDIRVHRFCVSIKSKVPLEFTAKITTVR